MKLRSSIVDVDRLTAVDRDAMFHLMDRTYANVRRNAFEADLEEKRWVIQVRHPATGQLAGFSTQVVLKVEVDGRPVHCMFSGDTVVDRQHWGDSALSHAWGRLALELIDGADDDPWYWFLTSKGFRTYRYLPLFFHQWFPRRESPMPPWERAVIDALGFQTSPKFYDPEAQIIRAAPGKDYVRPGLADPRARSLTDDHVRFFISQNPHYARGDELCCLAPLTKENFTPLAYRMIHATPSFSLTG